MKGLALIYQELEFTQFESDKPYFINIRLSYDYMIQYDYKAHFPSVKYEPVWFCS